MCVQKAQNNHQTRHNINRKLLKIWRQNKKTSSFMKANTAKHIQVLTSIKLKEKTTQKKS